MIFLPDDPRGVELTRPTAARGSILLAELVAILMVLELAVSKKFLTFPRHYKSSLIVNQQLDPYTELG